MKITIEFDPALLTDPAQFQIELEKAFNEATTEETDDTTKPN